MTVFGRRFWLRRAVPRAKHNQTTGED